MFNLVFYETPAGKRPVAEFILDLPQSLKAKAVRDIDILAERGNQLREPYSKHLQEGLFAYSGSSGQRSDVIRPVIPVGSGQVFRSDPASRSDGIRPMHPSGCPRYLKEQFVLVYQKSAGYQICTASL